jgi:hypothetical protein
VPLLNVSRITCHVSFLAFLAAFAAVADAAIAHAQEPPRPAKDGKAYANAKWRWSIAYPAGWTLEAKDPDLVRIRSAPENALCSIHSGPMDRFNTVDELTDFLLANDAQFFRDKGQKFTVLARRKISLPNRVVGNDVLVEIGPGGTSRRVHVLADGRGFAIDCEAYTKSWSRLEPAHQQVISSFSVRK